MESNSRKIIGYTTGLRFVGPSTGPSSIKVEFTRNEDRSVTLQPKYAWNLDNIPGRVTVSEQEFEGRPDKALEGGKREAFWALSRCGYFQAEEEGARHG